MFDERNALLGKDKTNHQSPLMTMFLSKLVRTHIRSEALKIGAIELIVTLAFLAILIKARK